MTQVQITTPAAGHAGELGSLVFIGGQTVADDQQHAAEIAYCRANGYAVTPLEQTPAAGAADGQALEIHDVEQTGENPLTTELDQQGADK